MIMTGLAICNMIVCLGVVFGGFLTSILRLMKTSKNDPDEE